MRGQGISTAFRETQKQSTVERKGSFKFKFTHNLQYDIMQSTKTPQITMSKLTTL